MPEVHWEQFFIVAEGTAADMAERLRAGRDLDGFVRAARLLLLMREDGRWSVRLLDGDRPRQRRIRHQERGLAREAAERRFHELADRLVRDGFSATPIVAYPEGKKVPAYAYSAI